MSLGDELCQFKSPCQAQSLSPKPVDIVVDLSVTSPAPCLSVCCHDSLHNDHEIHF